MEHKNKSRDTGFIFKKYIIIYSNITNITVILYYHIFIFIDSTGFMLILALPSPTASAMDRW